MLYGSVMWIITEWGKVRKSLNNFTPRLLHTAHFDWMKFCTTVDRHRHLYDVAPLQPKLFPQDGDTNYGRENDVIVCPAAIPSIGDAVWRRNGELCEKYNDRTRCMNVTKYKWHLRSFRVTHYVKANDTLTSTYRHSVRKTRTKWGSRWRNAWRKMTWSVT